MKKEKLKSDDTIREEKQAKQLSKCISNILRLFRICKKKEKKNKKPI